MADIAAFSALRFDPARVGDMASVIAPPYDVISESQRKQLEDRNPRNVVRLDLPRGEGDAKYEAARVELNKWIAEGTLRKDATPAIYRYEQVFKFPETPMGKTYTRKGFISLLRLEPAAKRVVLPHEKTLSGPKVDRQKLIRATRAHFSQVFGLYRDPLGMAEAALSPVEAAAPAMDVTTPDGCRHRLWVVTDAQVIGKVKTALAGKQVLVADGHHRYETMLGLRDELRPPGAPDGRPIADWGPFFLARAEDPGLLVLPTHRLVKDIPDFDAARLAERASRWFSVTTGSETSAAEIEQRLKREGEARVTFAVREPGKPTTLWFSLRADADLSSLGPSALRGLDVTVLHGLVLGPLLGIDDAAMARQAFLSYTHDTEEALGKIAAGDVQAGFLMNATKVHQVLEACEAGFVLPQKSTYFQPKLATGVVMLPIE